MAGPRSALMDAFDASAANVCAALDAVRESDLGKLGWHPRGLTPVDAWIGLRLVELVIHDWDIRHGFDPSVRPTAPGVEGMLTFLPAAQVRHFNVREKEPMSARFLFRTTQPGRAWTMIAEGGMASFRPGPEGAHDAAITADAEALLFLNYGRLSREEAERAGKLKTEGGAALVDALLGVLFAKY